MNRKQRRAATKLGPPASANSSDSGEQVRRFFFEAVRTSARGKFDDAVWSHKRALAIAVDDGDKLDAVATDPLFSLSASIHGGPRCRFRAAADSDAALPRVSRG